MTGDATDFRTEHVTWMSRAEFRQLGFRPSGPETDYGVRWGEQKTIRLSFAPTAGGERGYLYAHDGATDHFAVVCPDVAKVEVDAAWQLVVADPPPANGYLTLGAVAAGRAPLPVQEARDLWLHCLDREMAARRAFENRSTNRLAAARDVVVGESARVSSEDLLLEAVRAELKPTDAPAIVRYSVTNGGGWNGRVHSFNPVFAGRDMLAVQQLAERHGLVAQPTSLAHGHVVVSAARAPELRDAVRRAEAVRQVSPTIAM